MRPLPQFNTVNLKCVVLVDVHDYGGEFWYDSEPFPSKLYKNFRTI